MLLAVRRKRRSGKLAALLLAGAAFCPRPASAHIVFVEPKTEEFKVPRSDWNMGVKLGPYTPDIDSSATGPNKPYETMFGSGSKILMGLEVDRFFLWPLGQLGLAFEVGYLKNTAHAFAQDASGNPIYTTRSSADTTAFTLVPVSVSALYRFTHLADETYVPLVPYAKLGLTYAFWWTTKGDGSVSSTATGGSGSGGTLGWQGALGLELRLDHIDPGASRDLESELGVEHAGFFGEVTHADVSGLLFNHKLPVGDTTWFAGMNFEF